MRIYERIPVTIVSIDEMEGDAFGGVAHPAAYRTSIMELLDFMAGMDLKDQVYMLSNTLTAAGYTQAEIAEAIGVAPQSYRNRLWQIRAHFKDKGVGEL